MALRADRSEEFCAFFEFSPTGRRLIGVRLADEDTFKERYCRRENQGTLHSPIHEAGEAPLADASR